MECQVRDLNIHYEEAGTGKPLLILHGWARNARMAMADFEPSFAGRSGWRRIYPDLPGHGQTPIPAWLQTHDDLLTLLLELIDALAPGERFAVAGISWGGYLARGVLHHRLTQVDGAALIVPAFRWGESIPRQVLQADPAFAAALKPGEAWLLDWMVVQTPELLDSLRAGWLAHWTEQNPAIASLLIGKSFSFDPDVLPEPCAAPSLIVTGRQDNITGYQRDWPILDNFPRGTFAVLDRAGHFLGTEQPTLLRALVGEWLDRVEEYSGQKA